MSFFSSIINGVKEIVKPSIKKEREIGELSEEIIEKFETQEFKKDMYSNIMEYYTYEPFKKLILDGKSFRINYYGKILEFSRFNFIKIREISNLSVNEISKIEPLQKDYMKILIRNTNKFNEDASLKLYGGQRTYKKYKINDFVDVIENV
jgi:hypothetical protein